jgi:DNA-binding transcriptional ArsR family regulator
LRDGKNQTGLTQAARLFGVLAEPARLRILQLLKDDSLCGRELARGLNLTPATTCHHLEKLKLQNLLSERRSGKHVYYSISDGELARAVSQSLAALDHPFSKEDGKPANGKRKRESDLKREKTGNNHARSTQK